MSLFINGSASEIKRVFMNGVEQDTMSVNGVGVFQKFQGVWTGASSIVELHGFSTLGDSLFAEFGGVQAATPVLVDGDGVFTGESEYANSSGAVKIRGVAGGLQIAFKIATSDSGWSPTLAFSLGSGFAATTVVCPALGSGNDETVSLTGNGFLLTFSSDNRFGTGTGGDVPIL